MRGSTRSVILSFIGLTLLLTGCAGPREMMPTPNVHLDEEQNYFVDLQPGLKSTEVRLFYVTDRAVVQDEGSRLYYGYGRSESLAFGTVVVDLGIDITWDELVRASRTQSRLKSVEMSMGEVNEIVRGPPIPLPYSEVDGKAVEEPMLVTQREEARQLLREALANQLELTARKDVFLYVHGYHNTFEDAAFAMAELWHFLGRIGVPMIYTWPAGYPGVFGYTYDRESSEFTILHLRQVLKLIAGLPEVENMHVIAHSRGTDVAMNALREISLEARGAGLDLKEQFKIKNFVLAAPDLDVQVAEQRLIGDKLALSVDRLTVYTSPADKAIGVAATLFSSPRGRIGTYNLEHSSELSRTTMQFSDANIAFINFTGLEGSKSDSFGHSYFRDAPTVSSDLIMMLRDDIEAGEPGRPLENVGLKFWQIPPVYPPIN